MFETTELRILLSIKKKYLKVIEFYLENKNQEQVALAKKELQHILGILAEIGELQSI